MTDANRAGLSKGEELAAYTIAGAAFLFGLFAVIADERQDRAEMAKRLAVMSERDLQLIEQLMRQP